MTTIKEEAQTLLDSRETVYGDRVKNMQDVAKVFSGILGTEVRPDQVPLLMVGYKTVRASQTPDYEDNVKDIEGYAIMFREIIGDDMIPAVNTDEYLLEKNRRAMRSFERPVDAELAKFERAYNSRFEDEESTPAQAARMQKEVPSYQPGANMTPSHLMGVYQAQLAGIFSRSWRAQSPTTPVDKFAEIAAREAVEYFWLTFQRNAEFEKGVRERPAL
jgi:hypothetical protein